MAKGWQAVGATCLDYLGAGRLDDHLVFELADLLDLDADDVSGLEPFGRVHRGGDSAGRTGRDDSPGQQRENRRQRLDLREAIEDEVLRVRMLALFAVDERLQVERMRIADFVGRYDPWPDGSVRVERFAQRHGGGAALPIAHAHVVDDQVAGDNFV